MSVDEFMQSRIAVKMALINAYESALIALASGKESYTLDTGQSVQKVTNLDIQKIDELLSIAYTDLQALGYRYQGGGTFQMRPEF